MDQTKVELEEKIKAMQNFITAVKSGTFNGNACMYIAGLLNLLQREHDETVKIYESAHPTPKWEPEHPKVGATQ
jgi:hypothetical protein